MNNQYLFRLVPDDKLHGFVLGNGCSINCSIFLIIVHSNIVNFSYLQTVMSLPRLEMEGTVPGLKLLTLK